MLLWESSPNKRRRIDVDTSIALGPGVPASGSGSNSSTSTSNSNKRSTVTAASNGTNIISSPQTIAQSGAGGRLAVAVAGNTPASSPTPPEQQPNPQHHHHHHQHTASSATLRSPTQPKSHAAPTSVPARMSTPTPTTPGPDMATTAASDYHNPHHHLYQQHQPTDSSVSPLTSWSLDGFSHDPAYLASQDELRTLLFTTAQSAAPTRRCSPVPEGEGEGYDPNNHHHHQHQGDSAASGQSGRMPALMRQVLTGGRRLEYLKNYVGQVAPWLDMFDGCRAFGIYLPALARNSPALLYAILALSARQVEQKEGKQDSFDSLELYQEAIRLLTPLLQARDENVIAICVVLCCLEMMSASGQDWRRHLDGCAALFDSFGVNGFSSGLLQAVFWCYARMDLCGALMSDGTQSTLIEPYKWLPPGARDEDASKLFCDGKSPDMHANYAVYLCAKACELVSDRTKYIELGEENGCTGQVFSERWVRLWLDLQGWLEDRPIELLPVQTIDAKPFPKILFVHWAAISSNQLHHTACILLLNMMPKPMKLRLGPGDNTLSYAKRICGISLTNPHQGCLNNAIQPLWIAGRLLSHKSEHGLLVRLIKSIENSTGWATSWRIRDLELTWGYKVRKDRREEVMVTSPV